MNSIEFLELIRAEWCASEEQHKSFGKDLITFARKYHKERCEYDKLNILQECRSLKTKKSK